MPVYGSSRLGVHRPGLYLRNEEEFVPEYFTRTMGRREFELTDHLGNVNVTVSDRKVEVDDVLYKPLVTSYTDYYPFGYPMPERSDAFSEYRYGFNGQEKDNEVYGKGSAYSFKYRMYDARLGRFWSVDPLTASYPWNSPYAFAENSPIAYGELEGLERYYAPSGGKVRVIKEGSNEIRIINEKDIDKLNSSVSTTYLNSISVPFHKASIEAQQNVASSVYRYTTSTPLKSMTIDLDRSGPAASTYLGRPGEMILYPLKRYNGDEYLNDHFFNQVNIWYHEDMHNKGVSGSPFGEFKINKMQMEHWSYMLTTEAYKSWLRGVIEDNLIAQAAMMGDIIRSSTNRVKEVQKTLFQKMLKQYNINVDYINNKFGTNYKYFNIEFYVPKDESN